MGHPAHTNVYAAGALMASYDNEGTAQPLHFLLNDWLGAKRYETDASGTFQNSWTGLPFGDSLTATGPGPDAFVSHVSRRDNSRR